MTLDLRYLVDKAFPDRDQWNRKETEAHWKDLIVSTLAERATALKRKPRKVSIRREDREVERKIVLEICAEFPLRSQRKERLAAWRTATDRRFGKELDERTLYRRIAELRRPHNGMPDGEVEEDEAGPE